MLDWMYLAAVNLFARFEDTEPEEFRRVVEIDLMGQVHGAMAALPHLKQEGRGALVHVSSMAARRSIPLQSAYSAAKHGIDGFLESLRVELMHEGLPISVTNVMPATIDTPLFDKSRTKLGVKPVAPPPIYEPGIVVDAILHAAEHPERDLIVGGAARAILTSQQVSPKLVDTFFERFGIEVQHTDQPKSPDAPNNLFKYVEGYDRVEGSFSDQAIPGIFTNLPELNSVSRLAADTSTALGILATLQANGTILELLAEQNEEQRQVLQKLARESMNAYTELLDAWTSSLSGRDQQQLFQRTARQWVEQTQRQQQTFQQLAQEYVNAYMQFLNAPFSYRTGTREPPGA